VGRDIEKMRESLNHDIPDIAHEFISTCGLEEELKVQVVDGSSQCEVIDGISIKLMNCSCPDNGRWYLEL